MAKNKKQVMRNKYLTIAKHYEKCLEKYGDNHLGVDWPSEVDTKIRHKIMLDVILDQDKNRIVNLLDFGCGTSAFYKYILYNNITNINYSGLDISQKYISCCRKKFPKINYYCLDILKDARKLPQFDYIIMNGLFTEKRDLTNKEMFEYFRRMIKEVFSKAKIGVAFNTMSPQVDWKRKESFHLNFDKLAKFLNQEVGRFFIFKHDYGLYEFTTYIYRQNSKL